MRNCREITTLISAAQDRDLTRSESFSLKFHLLMCKHCNHYGSSVDQLRHMMDQYSEVRELPPRDEEDKP